MADKHPLVFGMRAIWPGQLARVEMHQTRTGGDLSHIRPGRTHLNQFLIGGPDWRERLEDDIRRASELNFRHAYAARRWARRRKKEAAEIRRNGPQDPWKRDRSEGPLREGVLTANRKFFEGDTPGFPSVDKENRFRAAALKFLTDQFGESCVAAWEDRDEEAYHIHFVIAPWVVSESKQAGKQRRLEPSSVPVVKSYEAGHDIAAEYFAGAGLVRGEKRAQARRDAFAAEAESELPAANVPCHEWRADEAVRLDKKRKKAARAWVQARKKEAAVREAEQRLRKLEDEALRRREEAAKQARHDRLEQQQREAELAARERLAAEKEQAQAARDVDLARREKGLVKMLKSVFEHVEPIRAAAKKLGLTEHPLVREGLEAVERLRVSFREWRGGERQR